MTSGFFSSMNLRFFVCVCVGFPGGAERLWWLVTRRLVCVSGVGGASVNLGKST